MPFNPQTFINTNQFGDYSSYMGMGKDDQMKSVRQVAAEAVGVPAAGGTQPSQSTEAMVPPTSFGEMATQQFDKAVAPFQQKMGNISNAWDQASQGNGMAAVNAYRGYAQPTPQPNVINQHYGVE